MNFLKLMMRQTMRDFRTTSVRWMVISLISALSAFGSVTLLTDRMNQVLVHEASAWLAADAIGRSNTPIALSALQKIEEQGWKTQVLIETASMLSKDKQLALAAVKSVSSEYPLRGKLLGAMCEDCTSMSLKGGPDRGKAWVDSFAQSRLDITIGDTVLLGNVELLVETIITQEPDRQGGLASFNPRIFVHQDDLQSARLLNEHSRASYKVGVASNTQMISDELLRSWESDFPNIRWESDQAEQEELRTTLNRATTFLTMVSLVAVVLSATALSLSARQYASNQIPVLGLARAMGAKSMHLTIQAWSTLTAVIVVASIAGSVLAWIGQTWLVQLVQQAYPLIGYIPSASISGLLNAWAVCALLILGFVAPPLLYARRLPTQMLLREQHDVDAGRWIGAATLGLLIVWQSASWDAGLFMLCVGIIVVATLLSMGHLVFYVAKKIQPWTPLNTPIRMALLGLTRRAKSNIVLGLGLGLSMFALSFLHVLQYDISTSWKANISADAPNRFLIEVLPYQEDDLRELMKQAQRPHTLFPLARMRITHINDVAIDPNTVEPRYQRTVRRELNISTTSMRPQSDILVRGDFSTEGVSLDEQLAEGLGIVLGDNVRFEGGGQTIDLRVRSLRKIDWATLNANFFVLIDPASMNMVQSQSLLVYRNHIDSQKARELDKKVHETASNAILINTEQIERQIQGVVDKALTAVRTLFFFTLLAGLLVLWTALWNTRKERLHEAALRRALGTTAKDLKASQTLEVAGLGFMMSLSAVILAQLSGYAVSTQILGISWSTSWGAMGLFLAVGTVLSALFGVWALRGIVDDAALHALRAQSS